MEVLLPLPFHRQRRMILISHKGKLEVVRQRIFPGKIFSRIGSITFYVISVELVQCKNLRACVYFESNFQNLLQESLRTSLVTK